MYVPKSKSSASSIKDQRGGFPCHCNWVPIHLNDQGKGQNTSREICTSKYLYHIDTSNRSYNKFAAANFNKLHGTFLISQKDSSQRTFKTRHVPLKETIASSNDKS